MKENYTIDNNGRQIKTEPAVKSSDEKIEAVIAQYSDQLAALGITEEQIAQAREAHKSGDIGSLPEELRPFAQEVMARVNDNGTSSAANSAAGSQNTSTANSATSAEK